MTLNFIYKCVQCLNMLHTLKALPKIVHAQVQTALQFLQFRIKLESKFNKAQKYMCYVVN
jgi:hypothetical protein